MLFAKILASGLAVSALGGAGVGIGSLFSGFLQALAETPEIESILFTYTLLGFALTEAIALFALMMSFVFIFAI